MFSKPHTGLTSSFPRLIYAMLQPPEAASRLFQLLWGQDPGQGYTLDHPPPQVISFISTLMVIVPGSGTLIHPSKQSLEI